MRRIFLAAFAVVLLHAAPAMAVECRNLALVPNGGTAIASSEWSSGYPISQINNGHSSGNAWYDATNGVWPDWGGVEWRTPTQMDRIIVRLATGLSGVAYDIRVQYWDSSTSSWIDVVGRAGQDNPVLSWRMPLGKNGTEVKAWDLAAPITTTRVRALFEGGTYGYSTLDEVEAYLGDGTCTKPGPPEPRDPGTPRTCTNRAPEGTATASSVHSTGWYPATGVNNDQVESGVTKGYWNDDTNGVWPDWVQVEWRAPLTINRVAARIPLAQSGFPVGEITLRRTRIQYWDATTSAWIDVVGRSGQPNPIVDWTGPIGRADGTETRTFDIAPVTTTKIRALIEDGSSDGWSWLDELQAYTDCTPEEPTPRGVNLALVPNGGTAIASSAYSSSYPIAQINNGHSSGNAWMDATTGVWPDWGGVEWRTPTQMDRIIVRLATGLSGVTYDIRVQYWDSSTSSWVDVVGRAGQDNPALNWTMPRGKDGTEVKTWDLATPITTTRIRTLFERGTYNSTLDEIEAYWMP